jgi:sigma-B regulation protein RsbU (phosphoserine phosphatase)
MATLFAVAVILYSGIWMYCVRWRPNAYLGIENLSSLPPYSAVVGHVSPNSGAERAGLRTGDRIVAINDERLDTLEPFYKAVGRGKPGDVVTLSVERPGAANPDALHITLLPWPPLQRTSLAETLAFEMVVAFPVWFVLVSFPVLFLRVEDRNAWLLALLFSGFTAGGPLFPFEFIIPHAIRGFALAYKIIFAGLFSSLFNYFFAVFPASSGLDRRFPQLKTVLLAGAVAVTLPIGLWTLFIGTASFALWLGVWSLRHEPVHWLTMIYSFGLLPLGLVSLISNGFFASSADVRRKIRVIVWGTVAGLFPGMILQIAVVFTGKQVPDLFPVWIWAPLVFGSFWLFPLSFAYAVVKHRVLEIPVLLKRSARYVLVQRGFIVLLFLMAASAVVLFTHAFSRFFRPDSNLGMVLSAVFGIVLVWASAPLVKRGTERIDRAFFRGAYDARVILQDLTEKTRTVTNRHELAVLLEQHIHRAMHPKSSTCYLEAVDTSLVAECGMVPPGLHAIPRTLPLLAEIRRRGKSWDAPALESYTGGDFAVLAPLAAECFVPMFGRDSRLVGLLVLGQRLSEEPFSGEDKRLLDSVASQAGIVLDSLRLAEEMAARMEVERRAALEMQVAKEVQDQLLPQSAPVLQTLECAGRCIQTRAVGGDYYDFLELRPQHVGLVLGDVSGKGISAALLMANLQANLRSRCAVSSGDIALQLGGVNSQLCKSSAGRYFATLFFADYDDITRRLLYSNCGHNPPVLLRADGTIERLTATATVLGLFEEWQCSSQETSLHLGDLLVIYSDGVTEAMNGADEEFGEARFIASLREFRSFTLALLLTNLVSAVQEFTGGIQSDDLTLVVARAL